MSREERRRRSTSRSSRRESDSTPSGSGSSGQSSHHHHNHNHRHGGNGSRSSSSRRSPASSSSLSRRDRGRSSNNNNGHYARHERRRRRSPRGNQTDETSSAVRDRREKTCNGATSVASPVMSSSNPPQTEGSSGGCGGGGDESAARMRRLREKRFADTHANYEEELMGSKAKRRRDTTNLSEESDAEEDSFKNASSSMHQPTLVAIGSGGGVASKGNIAENLMARMGYKQGEGLGLRGQGRVEPVGLSTQRGRVGLGHDANKAIGRDFSAIWDEAAEEKTVEETPKWLDCNDDTRRDVAGGMETPDEWMQMGKKKLTIDDETSYVDADLLKDMLEAKGVFDSLSDRELREARTRANPYETIGSAFFQNRAAMKTANLDRIFDWIFSKENPNDLIKKNPLKEGERAENTSRSEDIFFFADVCAGPGGFSEYMLWRKGFYNAKGFGFTLKGKDDFKLNKFAAASPHYFEPFYGTAGNGDVMNPENIDSLELFIMKGTQNKGVHLMMADGGFSVEGQENIQEILSKRLYLCQLLVALCIVREGGNFFCKLFDIFTPFSVSLIFLVYACFERVSIHKPHTSRPANSERYIICEGLRREDCMANAVRDYLKKANRELERLAKEKSDQDIVALAPADIISEDLAFVDYIRKSNDRLALRQTIYLRKYLSFAKNPGQIDKEQGSLRDRCLEYWKIPNRNRRRDGRGDAREQSNPDAVLGKFSSRFFSDQDWACRPAPFSHATLFADGDKWMQYGEYACNFLSDRTLAPRLLVSTGDAVFIRSPSTWERQDQNLLRLPPNTILLVEQTTGYHVNTTSKTLDQATASGGLIRVLDGAVLHGDDISRLPTADRYKCLIKFCRALKMLQSEVSIGYGPREQKIRPYKVMAAHTFRVEELQELRRRFNRLRYKGEEVVTHEEHSIDIIVRGVRGINILTEGWRMSYSSKVGHRYSWPYPPQPNKGSIFEQQWTEAGCMSDFWLTAVPRKQSQTPSHDHKRVLQWAWSWVQRTDSDYGPLVITTEEKHSAGHTITSILAGVKEVNRILGKEDRRHGHATLHHRSSVGSSSGGGGRNGGDTASVASSSSTDSH